MEIKNLKPNTKVKLHTKTGDFECVILESPNPEIILVKLNSGYNIGIREEDILDAKILKNEKVKPVKNKVLKSNKNLKNIALIITGGTISSKLDYKTGAVRWLTDPQELLDFYPELLEIANVKKIVVPFMKASENMDLKDWKLISESVAKLCNDSSIDGVIVTHGTDTLHYTASALSFALKNLNKPVVLTYSQRSSDRASSDARLNLACAARAAISDAAEVMLVGHASINDDFCYALKGSKVRKMHTSRRDTFRPINTDPLAKVTPEKFEALSKYKLRNNGKTETKAHFNGKVALIKFYPGQDPDIIEYYLKKGYKGLVIEMTGLGHVPTGESRDSWIPNLKKAIKSGMVICAAPQTLYGRLHPLTYSVGRELEKTGIIYLKDILPETAFVKLSWVLGDSKMAKKPKEHLLKNYSGEFSDYMKVENFLN